MRLPGFLRPRYFFNPPTFTLRTVPGPGAGNAAYIPAMRNIPQSPLGWGGIATTYPWQLTGRGDYFIKRLVLAGQVQGYGTGDFVQSGLLPEPVTQGGIEKNEGPGFAPGGINLSGATG